MIKNYVKFIPEIYPRIVIIAVLTVGLAVGGVTRWVVQIIK